MAVFLCAVLLVTVSERNWAGAIVVAMIFGPFVVIGSMQLLKEWSQRSNAVVATTAFNRKYHQIDFYLIAAMAFCALPIFWLYPYLPDVMKGLFDARGMAFGILIATVAAAFMWQPNIGGQTTNTRDSAMLGIIGVVLGGWLLTKGVSSRDLFLGCCFFYSALWTLFRAGLMFAMDHKSTAI